jgi:hypothetical protein
MGKKESVRILVAAFVLFLALYFFLRWAWGTEGFYANADADPDAPPPTATGDGLQINKSTMTSKYGEFGKVVPKSEDYVKPAGIVFPAVEVQQACTTWGQSWGVPFSFKFMGNFGSLRLYTPTVCKYILGGTYRDFNDYERKFIEELPERDILPKGYGYCTKDIQLGSSFNNQLLKNLLLPQFCAYLNFTTPSF